MATDIDFADIDDEEAGSVADTAVATAVETPDPQITQSDDVVDPSDDSVPNASDKGVEGGSTVAPQTQTAVNTTVTEQQPEFPPELLRSAGLTAEQAKSQFGSPDRLGAAVDFHNRQLLQHGRAAWNAMTGQQAPNAQAPAGQQGQPTQQPAAPQAQSTGAAAPQAIGFKPFEMTLDPNEWDPATIKLFGDLTKHYNDQFGQLNSVNERLARAQQVEQAVQSLLNVQVQESQRQYVQEFETMVDQLPAEWADTFGKGSGFKMDKASPQLTNRVKLDETMLMLARGRHAQGLQPLNQKDLFDNALRLEFPEKHNAIVTQKVIGKAASRQSQMVSRPTSRSGRQQTGEEHAIANATRLLAEKGIRSDGPNDDDDPEV